MLHAAHSRHQSTRPNTHCLSAGNRYWHSECTFLKVFCKVHHLPQRCLPHFGLMTYTCHRPTREPAESAGCNKPSSRLDGDGEVAGRQCIGVSCHSALHPQVHQGSSDHCTRQHQILSRCLCKHTSHCQCLLACRQPTSPINLTSVASQQSDLARSAPRSRVFIEATAQGLEALVHVAAQT